VETYAYMDALGVLLIAVVLRQNAGIHLAATDQACPVVVTAAHELVNQVCACSTIEARRRGAVIIVDLAVVSAPSAGADTTVREGVVEARA